MTHSAWIALASLAGFILVQTAIVAFFIGGMFARVKTLEDAPKDDCAAQLAAMNATMTALKQQVDRIEKRIDAAVESSHVPVPAAPRRRAA
jgi:hypothetical protein